LIARGGTMTTDTPPPPLVPRALLSLKTDASHPGSSERHPF
jgi:hypothetical protein